MNPEILEKVLSCRNLPTLPAVALRVIELTQNDNVSMRDLAAVIQNDQGLSVSILRTVNSSFYALRQRCSSINQAMVFLGLSAVKTLALGFSLVSAVSATQRGSAGARFDHVSYWRRGLFTGIAAKCIAKEARCGHEEECFLAGLLQDVGMLALERALGESYLVVLDKAAGDHRQLLKHELTELDVHHADIGAMLARRWRLPDELVIPIKYHERASAAPAESLPLVRAVALGNTAADVLMSAEPAGPLKRFYTRGYEWFNLSNTQSDDILRTIAASAGEMAALLSIDAGPPADAAAILARAHERLIAIAVPPDQDAPNPESHADPATGLPDRLRFDQVVVAAFEQVKAGAGPLTLAIFEADGLQKIALAAGLEGVDAVLASMAGVLRQAFKPVGGYVCRYDGARFGVVLHKTDLPTAARAAEAARKMIEQGGAGKAGGTASIGLASVHPSTAQRFEDVGAFVRVVESAVQAAARAGRNTVRVYAPAAAAA